MAIDDKDRLFLSTDYSIFYYDQSFSKITQINPAYFSDFITGSDGIIPLYFDSKGLLWIGRNGKGVMSIDLVADRTKIYDQTTLSDETVRTITEDKRGRMWFGTEKGITILNPDGRSEIIQQDYVDNNKLNDNAIYDILCDNDENVWVGTYFGGVNMLRKNNDQFNWIEAGYGSKNIKGKVIRKIVEPVKDILWIATEDGGLNIYNTITGKIVVFDRIPQMGHNVHSLYYDSASRDMWIGTFRKGLFRYNLSTKKSVQYLPNIQKGLSSDAIFYIAKQRSGTIWIATTQGLRYYDPKKDIFLKINHSILDQDFIYCLLVDKEDNVWVGTHNNGLFRIDAQTNEINSWSANTFNSQLKDKYITSLYQDSQNRIWIGSNNYGLQYIDPSDLIIKTPDKELSLAQATIYSTIEDEFGRLWISTNRGLYQFNKERCAFVCYTVEDGLPVNQFNFASSIQSRNGLLYFGSVDGLISFIPKAIKNKRKTFSVQLTQLNIDNKVVTSNSSHSPLTVAVDDMKEIVFSHDQSRSFSIDYRAISLTNTSTINYQIRLLGAYDNWENVGRERKFVGSNLPSGSYTLQIRANNSNEGWEKAPIKQVKLVIKPPFYLSFWAFLIYIFILGLVIYFTMQMFIIRLQGRNAVRLAHLEKEKIEEINQTKIDFFTSVSHELKTPLSLIVAPLKYISITDKLSPESMGRLDIAIKNTNKMIGLMDELVTFNRIESGNFQFYLQKGNPLDFIENVSSLFNENAQEKSISLYTYCENNGEEVWFSPSYVEKIINNLLSNAIKYTSLGGEVSISAYITDNPDGNTYLSIKVSDTGIGISSEAFDNIFEKHYQTKQGHNVNNKGWGIGLTLVKKLTSIHKGQVSVESKIGVGSCFTVILNVTESAFNLEEKINVDKTLIFLDKYEFTPPNKERIPTAYLPVDSKKDKVKPSILLVEDNDELLKFMADIFSQKYNIYLTRNGIEALDIARTYPVDLVISDVMMCEMDGNTLCINLKNDILTSHIPVILLTAKSDTVDVMRGYESGAEAYVTKPFNPQILELQVNNIIQIKQVQRKKIANTLGSDVDSESLSRFDKEFIHKMNELIEKNIENNDFSVVDVTRELGLSRSVLHVKMKSLLDISMGDYIRKKRLSKACNLLQEGYNVTEAAYKVGFSDPHYFSKTFKKEFGKNPSEYQKSR